MQLFLKILDRMANSVDSDQTAPSGSDLVYAVYMCHFVRNFDVRNFRIFTVHVASGIRGGTRQIFFLFHP